MSRTAFVSWCMPWTYLKRNLFLGGGWAQRTGRSVAWSRRVRAQHSPQWNKAGVPPQHAASNHPACSTLQARVHSAARQSHHPLLTRREAAHRWLARCRKKKKVSYSIM